jgi:hypothetical protein
LTGRSAAAKGAASAAPGFEYQHRPDLELGAAAQPESDGAVGLNDRAPLHEVGMVK